MDKENVVDMHNGIVFSLRKKGHFDTFCIINEPEDMLILIHLSVKKKYYMILLI